jgi:hypothetical protein
MAAVLVAQDLRDSEEIKKYMNDLKFEYTVFNGHDTFQKLEGLRFTHVFFTYKVLIAGMDPKLFEVLYGTLVRYSTNTNLGFQLLT